MPCGIFMFLFFPQRSVHPFGHLSDCSSGQTHEQLCGQSGGLSGPPRFGTWRSREYSLNTLCQQESTVATRTNPVKPGLNRSCPVWRFCLWWAFRRPPQTEQTRKTGQDRVRPGWSGWRPVFSCWHSVFSEYSRLRHVPNFGGPDNPPHWPHTCS